MLSTPAARATVDGLAKVGEAGLPPPLQRTATGKSEMPMMVMMVPVTSGGKNLSRRLK
jgi:hypothetical protein